MKIHYQLTLFLTLIGYSIVNAQLVEVYHFSFEEAAISKQMIDKRSTDWTEGQLDKNGLILKGDKKNSTTTKSALVPINFSEPFEIKTDFYTFPEFNKGFKGGLIIGLDHNMQVDDYPSYGLAFIITGDQGYEIINYKKEGAQILAKDTSSKIDHLNNTDHILTIKHDGESFLFYYDESLLIKIHNIQFHKVLRSGLIVMGKGSIHARYFQVNAPEDSNWAKKLEQAEIKDKNINVIDNPFFDNTIENLGTKINSDVNELDPHISPDGRTLYFIKKGYQLGHVKDDDDYEFHDSFWSTTIDSNLSMSKAQLVPPPFNQEKRMTGFNASADGQTILIQGRFNEHQVFLGEGFSLAKKTTDGWSDIEPIKIPAFNEFNRGLFYNGFLASDGKTLLINSSKTLYSEHEDYRIFVSFKSKDGKWTKPKDLGPSINIPEAFTSTMFLASDMKTLYFSSDGHPGYGDGDIFMSKRKDNTWTNWSTPLNLGPVINGPYWDAYFTVPASGDYAYFVSHENTLGKADIFRVKLKEEIKPEPVMLVKGYVLDAKTNRPVHTSITVNDLHTNKQIAIASSDPKTGFYEIILTQNGDYSFFAEKKGYYSIRENISLENLDTYKEKKKNLYLTPFDEGAKIKMNNIFFVQSKPDLLDDSKPELDKLVLMMRNNKALKIKIEGHTDNQGSAYENLKLSKERAITVMNYLIDKGIDKGRLTAEGYGESKPIVDNNNLEVRHLNRRVEFLIQK